jgi:chromate reductase, NAD(P)H dehydrogenase (quinone)
MHPVNTPGVMVNFANQKFDDSGKLTDDKAKELIKKLLRALIDWVRQLQSGTVNHELFTFSR